MTYAVIRFGGRQFKVSEGDKFKIQRQQSSVNEVLMYCDGKSIEIGTPVLKDIEVKLAKVEDTRDKKIRIGRFKSKSRYRKVKGHKQPISIFKVEKIGKKGGKSAKVEKKVEKVVEKKPVEVEKKIVEKKPVEKVEKKETKKVAKTTTKRRGRPTKKESERKEEKK